MSEPSEDMQPLSCDPFNAFEHRLRTHVREARTIWNDATRDADGREYAMYVSFDGDDGKWSLRSYTPDITTRGAELMEIIRAHVSAWRRQQSLQSLRGVIAPPER